MRSKEEVHRIAERRINLLAKNELQGLTESEIIEYRKLRRIVMDYIKRKYPKDWESVKKLTKMRRAKFRRIL